MGRRLSLLIGMALAFGVGAAFGAGPAPAEDPPAPAPTPSSTSSGADLPLKLPPIPAEGRSTPAAELPAGFTGPSGAQPNNVGPDVPSAGSPGAGTPPLSKSRGKSPTANATAAQAGDGTKKDEAVTRAQTPAPTPVAAPDAAPALPPAAPALPAPAEPGPPAPVAVPVAVPSPAPAAAPRDPLLEPSQAVGTSPPNTPKPLAGAPPAQTPPAVTPIVTDTGPLPPATPPPGTAGSVPTATPGAPREPKPPFVLTAEELPLGRQSVGLTVDVIAPQVLNLNQTANFKVVIKNNGQTDARGVVVRDQLPEGLHFVSSQPEAEHPEGLLVWNLGTVGAGSEKTIALVVKPMKTGSYDHAATVTMMAGGKSRTIVREPKLKVEQTVGTSKILLGQPVQFKIAVSNPGDGPARNVVVTARLSTGLRHEAAEPSEQNLLEQTIDLINPGERVALDTLMVDAKLGGEQSCRVEVSSPDVVPNAPEAKSVQNVTVIEPKLTMKLAGPENRYTDTLATYEVILENLGSAPAQNVKLQSLVPVAGRLYAVPGGARFDPATRRLSWTRAQLQPGEKATYTFQVRMGGVGMYQVAAEARADSALLAKENFTTNVTGLADIVFNVEPIRRVVDVNEETNYVIKVSNIGTKEATKVLITAVLSPNLQALETNGTEEKANYDDKQHKIVFPQIERLGPNKSIELGIRVVVKAADPKLATCRVFLMHEELTKEEQVEDVAAFKVTPTRR